MDWIQYLPVLVVIAGVIYLIPLSKQEKKKAQHRLNDWAKSAGVTILNQRFARIYEGPDAWRKHESQDNYRLEVRDGKGRVRVVWLTVGDASLMLEANPDISKVVWD